MDEAAFQAEVFKLRSREWPYYLAANRDSLQAVPDLSDLSGGLSNPAQFNFIMYILWKARQDRHSSNLIKYSERPCDADDAHPPSAALLAFGLWLLPGYPVSFSKSSAADWLPPSAPL